MAVSECQSSGDGEAASPSQVVGEPPVLFSSLLFKYKVACNTNSDVNVLPVTQMASASPCCVTFVDDLALSATARQNLTTRHDAWGNNA